MPYLQLKVQTLFKFIFSQTIQKKIIYLYFLVAITFSIMQKKIQHCTIIRNILKIFFKFSKLPRVVGPLWANSCRDECIAHGLHITQITLNQKNPFLLHKIFYNFKENKAIITKLDISLENSFAHPQV